MRWCIGVSVLALFATGCGRNAAHYADLANQELAARKLDDASINFRKAIQKDPKFADAYYGLGKVLLQQGKAPDAYAALTRAVELAPSNLGPKQLLANLVLAAYLSDSRHPKNLYDQLNKLAADFLARDARSYDGLRLKAYLALNDNQRDTALDYFRKALQAKPLDPEITITLAGVLAQDPASAGDAEKMVLDLIQKRKQTSAAYDFLTRYYLVTKRPADAEGMLKAKVSAFPEQAGPLLELAAYEFRAGRKQDTTALINGLLSDPKTFPQARLQAGDFYNQTGDRAQALKYFQEGGRTGSAEQKLVYQRREIATLIAMGRADDALARLDQVLQANPKDRDLRMGRAMLLLDQRKAEPALAALQGLEKEQNADPVIKYQLGRALLLKGDAKDATAKWQEAVKLRPSYLDPQMALASYAIDLRNYADAERLTGQILATNPDNVRAQVLRAMSLQGLNRMTEAEVLLTQALQKAPRNTDVQLEFGYLQLRQNKAAEGEKILRGIYTPGQQNLRPLTGLVQSLLMQKRGDEAQRVLQADLAKAPGRTAVQYLLANTYAVSGHPDTALKMLDQIVAAHPDDVQARLALAQMEAAKGDFDPALASLAKARDMAPTSIQPLLLLAETADRAQRSDLAKQSYQAALKLDASNVIAMNNLAYMEAESGGNLDEALRLITLASQKLPQQANLTDTLGYVYLKQKKYASAIQVFDGLARRYPSNPTFLFHHGLALLAAGDKEQAKRELQAALAAKPPADLATKIKEALGRV